MNAKQLLIGVTFVFAAAGAAQANQTWAWSYSGTGVTASGTFVTAGQAVAPEDILSVTGTRNGVAIAGLVPIGDDDNFSYDNQFSSVGDHFSSDGVLFAFAGGLPNINLYFFEGGYSDLYVDDVSAYETPVSFRVAAVPEPATVLSMLVGLGLLAAYTRKSERDDG